MKVKSIYHLRRYMIAIVTLLMLLFLSACTMGPDYVKPEVDISNEWRIKPERSKAIVKPQWWKAFNDPVLDDLIVIALKNNQDARIAAARVQEFAARVDIASSGFYPQIGYSADARRNQLSREVYNGPSSGSRTYNNFAAGLNIGWELDFWGRISRLNEAARADLLAAEAGRRTVLLSLVSAVATYYIQLRSLDEQLLIAQDTVKRRYNSVVLFKEKFTAGVISELEVAQVQSEYELARARIPAIERQIALLENSLSVLLGQNPTAIMRSKPGNKLSLPHIPAAIPSQVLEQRPDIYQAEQNLIAANALIGVAKAEYFPQINLTGLLGFASESLSSLVRSSSGTWNAGGELFGPIFTAGRLDAQVKLSEAEQRRFLAQYIQSIQTALQEVNDALISSRKIKEEFNAQTRQVNALKEYAHYARIRYNDGYVSYIEVLDSERRLFDAQLQLTIKESELFASIIAIYKSMGGGWVDHIEQTANEVDKLPKAVRK
jgi:multidrug efflux system outer membrane protein